MANTKYIISLVDRLTDKAQKMQRSLNNITERAERATQAIDGIGLLAGGAALAGIFKFGAELESTQLKFNTLTGSIERGTKLFNELTEFANATPFSNEALNKNATTLLSFGEDADSVATTLRMLGDVAAGDAEKLGSLTLAFAQSQAAGKLMGQDLLQFINAGFNPLQTIAEQTGQSMSYLKDQMSKGAISADMVRMAFEAATGPGGRFHNLTNDMADTMAGKWSTVMGKARFLIGEFGLSMKDIFLPFLDGAIKAIEFVSRFRDIIFPVLTILTTMTGVLLSIVGAIKLWIGVQKIINALLIANPIGLIITLIAGLITAIVILWQRSEAFRRVMLGTWEVLKEVGKIIKEIAVSIYNRFKPAIDSIWNAVKGFISTLREFFSNIFGFIKNLINAAKRIGQVVKEALKGNFEQAGKLAKNAFDGIFDIDSAKKVREYGQRLGDAYRRGAEKAVRATDSANVPGLGIDPNAAGNVGSIGLSSEVKKLQAEGVVSGGIKTFNINISNVTGVNTLSTTTVQESAEDIGEMVTAAIIKGLSDIRNVG